jgi:putative SOS response-associated peptidase YedK
MPVILADSDWSKWLGEEAATDDELSDFELIRKAPRRAG